MKYTVLNLLLLVLIASCGSNKILVEKLDSLVLEYNQNEKIYFGDTLELKAFAKKKTGEKVDISRSFRFELEAENAEYLDRENILVVTNRPSSFDIDEIKVKGVLVDENDMKIDIE